jgi:type VI secretion system protein ImpE
VINADELLKQGNLDGARKALVEVVRSSPSDEHARMFLFQLLALMGEWSKAKNQLTALSQISPAAQMLSVAYGQAIAAEEQRAAIFAGTAEMPLLVDAEWARPLAKSIHLHAQGDDGQKQALALQSAAFDAAPDTPGTLDGISFDWIANADARFGPSIEVIIGGHYGLLTFDSIVSIKGAGPQDLRDLIWYPVEIAFKAGQSVAAMLPARYPGSELSQNADHVMARATDWLESGDSDMGIGQHLLSLSGDNEAVGLLSLRALEFD